MTPTEQWILGLALVYSVPSFISGIGMTLLVVRWRDIRRAVAMTPRFLSPELTLEQHDFIPASLAPADEVHR
jgi:hypothetical protein